MICRKGAPLVCWPLGPVGWLAACSSLANQTEPMHDAALTDTAQSRPSVLSCHVPLAAARDIICFVLLCCSLLAQGPRATVSRHA